jgi:hypothetical protein
MAVRKGLLNDVSASLPGFAPIENDYHIDRIMIYRNRTVLPINHVNPIYIDNLEQIHMVAGSPFPLMASPTNHDLL